MFEIIFHSGKIGALQVAAGYDSRRQRLRRTVGQFVDEVVLAGQDDGQVTLHNRNNTRILGFDNAHAHKPERKQYGARKVTWDHKHKMKKVYNYEFESASELIEDFWEAVDKILK